MTKWTNEFLDPMRRIGDEPADQLIQAFFAGKEVGAINALMREMVASDAIPSKSIPEDLREFLKSVAVLPEWADVKKLKAGQELFWEHGPAMVLILFCYSLPFCYAARREAQALGLTGRLSGNPRRRVTETAQMLIDVMAPGGLTGPGTGIRTIERVRLMHAAVRYLIAKSNKWDLEIDCPLNQEDLAGTLMSFTSITFDGLRRLDINLSKSDAEAYLHCWNVVGHILGIREDLLPADLDDAEAFTAVFKERQFAASEEGRFMTSALLEAIASILPRANIIPETMFEFLPRALTYYFVGEKMAGLLGVEPAPFENQLFAPLKLANRIAGDIEASPWFMRQLVVLVSRHLLEALEFVARGGNRPSFNIPTELRQHWGINWRS
jgi:hypothetical protein